MLNMLILFRGADIPVKYWLYDSDQQEIICESLLNNSDWVRVNLRDFGGNIKTLLINLSEVVSFEFA